MDGAAADRHDVIQRARKRGIEIAFASGQRGEAEFRAVGRVDAELGQAMALQLGLHRGRRTIIGKLQFDCAEASRRGGAKPFEQRAIGKQIAEIGGEARHGVSLIIRGSVAWIAGAKYARRRLGNRRVYWAIAHKTAHQHGGPICG
jgi:hypothetical protein